MCAIYFAREIYGPSTLTNRRAIFSGRCIAAATSRILQDKCHCLYDYIICDTDIYVTSTLPCHVFCHIFSRRLFITLSLTATSFSSVHVPSCHIYDEKYRTNKHNSNISLLGPSRCSRTSRFTDNVRRRESSRLCGVLNEVTDCKATTTVSTVKRCIKMHLLSRI